MQSLQRQCLLLRVLLAARCNEKSTTGGISRIVRIPTTTYAINSPADSKPVPDSDTAVQPQKRGGKDRWMCYSCCVGCFLCFSRCFGTCGRKRVPRNQLNERGQETNAQLDLEHGLNGGGVQSDMDPGSNMRGSKLSLDKKDGLNEYEAPESPPPAYTKKDLP
ncbi:hypothetical protein C8R42DRAFT_638194 [Lentinula raphanica]|nr:hypothetical protein C8R42DRAFT_638194 [Lentinula raphanica]